MEWRGEGEFEDRSTVAIINRYLPVPTFSHSLSNGVLTITTAKVKLVYTVGKPFSAETLQAGSIDPAQPSWAWRYGDDSGGNLLGTIRSLDLLDAVSLNCTENAHIRVHDEQLHCAWGLVSRDGWVVLNDTGNAAFDGATNWWAGRSRDAQDLYLFGHGHDYMGALTDYSRVGGRAAMVPRSASGVWWSIWWNVGSADVRYIVDSYEQRGLPLDVYVLDMDWHTKQGWGGYSFDARLFPFPASTLGGLRQRGLTTLCNLHDADGVRPSEDGYHAFCAALAAAGRDGKKGGGSGSGGVSSSAQAQCDAQQTVSFSVCGAGSQAYMTALEDVVLGNVTAQGMDYYWIDWQQGGTTGGCAGGQQNPTFMLNRVRGTDRLRRGPGPGQARGQGRLAAARGGGDDAAATTRDMILARFGGLGSHRYQVGFSGDVATVSWSSLAFQPYFSLTASNVGFGYWSHDIVAPRQQPELMARWVQWGAFSGVMRTHDRGMSAGPCANSQPTSTCDVVRVWELPPPYFAASRAAMRRRQALLPYIYTAARQAFDTGVCLLRPMYYYWPSLAGAYLTGADGRYAQYMFGPDILAAPVVSAASATTSMATKTVWLPPRHSEYGELHTTAAAAAAGGGRWAWFQDNTGKLIPSADVAAPAGLHLTTTFALDEIPLFIRAGAVLPTLSDSVTSGESVGVASQQYSALQFTIYPGGSSGSSRVYEDDGISTAYATAASPFAPAAPGAAAAAATATTTLWYTRSDGAASTAVKVGIATNGSFPQLPASRSYTVRLRNFLPLAGDACTVAFTHALTGRRVTRPLAFRSLHARRRHTATRPRAASTAAGAGAGAATWSYDGATLTAIVDVAHVSTAAPLTLLLRTAVAAVDDGALAGIVGGMARATKAKRNFDRSRVTPGAHSVTGGELTRAASTGDQLTYLAAGPGQDLGRFWRVLSGFRAQFRRAVAEVNGMTPAPFFRHRSLLQLYSARRGDSVLCGCAACVRDNSDYTSLRVEGWQPSPTAAGAVPLVDYWSASRSDNLATPGSAAAAVGSGLAGEYAPAFSGGYILSVATATAGGDGGGGGGGGGGALRPPAGTAALQLWYSRERQDFMTVSEAGSGVAYAQAHGYRLVNATLGYLFTSPPLQAAARQRQQEQQQQERTEQVVEGGRDGGGAAAVNFDRWAYSVELLASAMQ